MAVTIDGTNGISTPDLESAGQVLAFGVSTSLYPLVSSTAVASTSGTSIDFNSIPSWAKRITVMFSGVSTTGTSPIQIQLGTSGGIESTGYVAFAASIQGAFASSTGVTTGFPLTVSGNMSAGGTYSGPITFSLLTTSVFTCSGSLGREAGSGTLFFATGGKTVSGTLDRIRITTANGTDTFDAGSINILYE